MLIVLALPLVLGLVPMNRWYGYRTPGSMSSPREWRRLNRIGGIVLLAAALLAVGIKFLLLSLFPSHPDLRYLNLIDAFVLLLATAGMVLRHG